MADINAKIDFWKSKLLDMSLRNKLLNYRETKRSTLRFENPDIFSLWTSFVTNEEPLIFPLVNEDEDDNGFVDPEQLITNQSPKDRQKTLRNLRTKSRNFMEEQGINVLYLSFGFLQWMEEGRPAEKHDAPLILVPVTLRWESIMSPYILELHEDEILVNPTLSYKLENDFGIQLPLFEIDAPLEDFFAEVESVTAPKQWHVVREVSMGMLSFLKINMYQDMEIHRDSIIKNPVIQAIGGDASGIPHNLSDIDHYDFDHRTNPDQMFQVVDADSSQQDAILCAKKGISFVLQGPPGTGKSQTITNIIAECLADGKKVLFVSEKMAALDVVYKRLSEANLADFCLVLHSYKANKKQTLEQLGDVLQLANKKASILEETYQKMQRLRECRDKLNQYSEQVYAIVEPLHKNIFEVNGILSDVQDFEEVIFSVPDVRKTSAEQYNKYLSVLDRLADFIGLQKVDHHKNPWRGADVEFVSNELRHDITFRSGELIDLIAQLAEVYEEICERLSISTTDSYAGAETLLCILEEAKSALPFHTDWINRNIIPDLRKEILHCEDLKFRFLKKREEIIDELRTVQDNDGSIDLSQHDKLSDSVLLEAFLDDINVVIENDDCYRLWQDKNIRDQIDDACPEAEEAIIKYLTLHKKISDEYEQEIFKIPFDDIYFRFKTDSTARFKVFNGQYKADKKLIQSMFRGDGKKLKDNDILNILSLLREDHEKKEVIDERHKSYAQLMPKYYCDEETDFGKIWEHIAAFDAIMRVKSLSEELRLIIEENQSKETELEEHYHPLYTGIETDWDAVRSSVDWAESFKDKLGEFIPKNESFIDRLSADRQFASECNECADKLSKAIDGANKNFQWFISLFDDSQNFEHLCFDELKERLNECNKNFALLEEWIDYESIKKECCDIGLDQYIEEFERLNLDKEHILPVFKKRFFRLWLDSVFPEYPAVANFRRRVQDNTVEEFTQLDKAQFAIASSRIRHKLISGLPSMDRFTSGVDEISILRRELRKQRRIMPIRKLFNQIPELIMVLKPCLMMSPLSVSLYLESDSYCFDTVIFDEASQVYTENAIGAISRGKQVIIAGDSKQLPPTSFFKSAASDIDFDMDDESDEIDDNDAFESVLDEATLLPERTLLWHYRSKHEHLIAFSNAKIYQNHLITFPSSVDRIPDIGVEYSYVENGYYDRGGKKGNVEEAKKVAKAVFKHFQDHPERSLGVITFGEVQQLAIDAELRRMREEDLSYEPFFNEDRHEPFFIKSLENVQGDERDTIIFSIGYGKDPNGTMRMNFGPLSVAGGERRLNVAITRAKYNVKLFGSILPTDIDLSHVSREGPKLLRSYIEFAINGPSVLMNETAEIDERRFNSLFEESVFRFLEEKGYQLDTRVGCSEYRIDLAVKHPTLSGRYIMGIECDGASYHSARTARERDRLRREVLEGIGWNIYRIWSTDWIKDPIMEGNRLLEAINGAINNCWEDRTKEDNESALNEEHGEFLKLEDRIITETDLANPYHFDDLPLFINYSDLPKYYNASKGDEFMHLSDCIMRVIDSSYPVHIDEIFQHMAPLLGREKVTSIVRNSVLGDFELLDGRYIEKDSFYFPIGCDLNDLSQIPHRRAGNRTIKQICTLELASGMLKVAESCVGATKESLITETVRAFGFSRSGPNIMDAMDKAFECLIKLGYISESYNKIVVIRNGDSR